jgi:surface carbohydrate biosynthesis protein
MCKLYKSHIRGEQFVIGSFKSNNIPIQKSTNKSVLFLSSFSEFNENNYFGKNINGNKITFTQFYSAESKILETLNKWAENKNLKFDILPRLENSEQERDFFIRSTKNIFLNFIDRKKKSFQNSYVLIDEYDLIITIDSTLGYEAIARKKKVMFIPLRSNFIEDDSFNFSWPCEFEKNGPFWITDFDQEILINKLEYIYNIGQEEWHEKYDFINNQVMVYDHSNSFFKNKLNEIIKIN